MAGTLSGRLFCMFGRADIADVSVWLRYAFSDGTTETNVTTTDGDGEFTFALSDRAADAASVGADLRGAVPVDLEPGGSPLEPGDVVVAVDDNDPHGRAGGLGL